MKYEGVYVCCFRNSRLIFIGQQMSSAPRYLVNLDHQTYPKTEDKWQRKHTLLENFRYYNIETWS